MITVYGQPGCYRCKATVDYLNRRQIEHKYVDVSVDRAGYDVVALLQYQELPVVTVGDMHWSGHRPSKLDQVIEIMQAGPIELGVLIEADAEATAYLMGT